MRSLRQRLYERASCIDTCLLYTSFVERTSTVLCGDHVTLEAGTGCVHTAPAHGEDDFNIVMRYNKEGKTELPIVSLVNETGNYTKQVDDNRYGDTEFPLAGVEIHDAEVPVIKILAHNNALLHKSSLRHQYACLLYTSQISLAKYIMSGKPAAAPSKMT